MKQFINNIVILGYKYSVSLVKPFGDALQLPQHSCSMTTFVSLGVEVRLRRWPCSSSE